MRRSEIPVFLLLAVLLVPAALAQSRHTEHTLALDDPTRRPPAKIADIAWLAGSWAGPGFGGTAEEAWSRPSAGTMVGTFKLVHDGAPSMYELELIIEEQGSLNFLVRHFNSDFTAWEDEKTWVSFPLVKLDEDAAYFNGLTIRRLGKKRLRLYLAMKTKDGYREEILSYERVRAAH